MPGSNDGARRVQRAKAAGRGARVPREVPLGFYTALAVVVILGIAAIGYSRYEIARPASAASTQTPPRVGQTWYVALGFDACGTFAKPLAKGLGASSGMTSLGNGVVEIHPTRSSQTGAAANLAAFLAAAGVKVSASGFALPGSAAVNAAKGCQGKAAELRIATWPSLLATTPTYAASPASVRFSNGEVVTVAVVAKGQQVPQPPNAANLANK
jgi:hypothetical protein